MTNVNVYKLNLNVSEDLKFIYFLFGLYVLLDIGWPNTQGILYELTFERYRKYKKRCKESLTKNTVKTYRPVGNGVSNALICK